MTRDEAVKIATAAKQGGGSSEFWLVNALAALGILRLVEAKSATHKLCEELAVTPLAGKLADITDAIDRAGLKLVDK